MKCCMCGGDDLPMHRYGEASVYSKNPGSPIYACSSCDPISEEMARELGIKIHPPKAKAKKMLRPGYLKPGDVFLTPSPSNLGHASRWVTLVSIKPSTMGGMWVATVKESRTMVHLAATTELEVR